VSTFLYTFSFINRTNCFSRLFCSIMTHPSPRSTLFPYTTLFRSLTIRAQPQSVGGQGQLQRVHGLTLPGRPVGTTNDAGRLTGSVRHRPRSRGGGKRCAEVPRWAHPAADQAGRTPRRLAMRTRADPPMIAARPKKIAAPISTPVRGSIPPPSPANPGPSPPPDEPLPSPPSELPVAPPPAASASCEPAESADPSESSEPPASDEPSVPPAPAPPFASSEPAESSLPFASSPGSPGISASRSRPRPSAIVKCISVWSVSPTTFAAPG